MRSSLVISLLLLAGLSTEAQNVRWIRKSGPVGGKILDIEVDAPSGNIILLDGDHRPYVSRDGGQSWKKIPFANASEKTFNDVEIITGTIFLVGSYELYASVDNGETFESRMSDASPYDGAYHIRKMPSSGNLIALCYNGSIYTSSNNGIAWTLKNSTLSGTDTRYLEVNSVDQIFILKPNAGFEVRPFRSSDGGVNFTEASTGIPAGQHVLGLYGDNNGSKVYAVTGTDIFSSTNGTTWTSVKTGDITDAAISDYGDENNSLLEFSADGAGMFFIDNLNHKLYSKTLAETNWALQATNFPSGSVSVFGASANNYPDAASATAFFGTQSGVFKTTTGGASVSESNSGIASIKGQQLEIDYNGRLYLKTDVLGLMKSDDGGNNWAKVSTLASNIDYFFTSGARNALFAISSNTLQRSFDGGSNWFTVSPAGGLVWADSPEREKVFGFQNTDYPASLYYSSDDGSTWTSSPVSISGLPASFSISASTIRFASASRMFLSLYDYGALANEYYRIDFTYNSSDAITAATATKISTLPIAYDNITSVAAADGKFYVYEAFGSPSARIAISEDGGVTWTIRTVPESDQFYVMENGYLFFGDGSDDKLYISSDDAATFVETTVPASANIYNLRDIQLNNEGYAYLTFSSDYVYESTNAIVIPDAPGSLELTGSSSTAIALRWVDENPYEHDIVVERSLNGTDFEPVAQLSGGDRCQVSGNRGFFVDTNLSPSTNYSYWVKASNAAGVSTTFASLAVSTLASCTANIPDNRSWSAINTGTGGYSLLSSPVTVGIKHVGGDQYEVSDLSLGLAGSAEVSTFYESCGQTFVGETGSLNPDGNSTWDGTTTLKLKWRACYADKTETIVFTLNATDPAPEQPQRPYAYILTDNSIELKWTAAYFEKEYVLERSLNPTSGFSVIATIDYPATRYVDNTSLVVGTTYYYRLKSRNSNATPLESAYSEVASVLFAKPNFLVADNAITQFDDAPTLASIWADFNKDGLDDYFTMAYDALNEVAAPLMFRNAGGGTFEQLSPGIGSTSYFFPTVADFDNDGYPDLALSGEGTSVFDIFKGNGDFTFTRIAADQLGDLAALQKDVSASSAVDFNNDGLLDLMLLNQDDASFTLFTQNADHSFTKIQEGDPFADSETSLAVWADYDNDGYQDVLISNTDGAGRLFHNNGGESLSLATSAGLNAANFFAAAWGDYNNDGYPDLFCGNITKNALYKNNGDGTFTEDLSTAISEPNLPSSASWGDYNNDGYLDLITVGFLNAQTRLFLRDPAANPTVSFRKVINEKINDLSVSHYSVANSDLDGNGLLDVGLSSFIFDDAGGDQLLATSNNMFQNNNPVNNWSEVRLVPKSGGAEAVGARISLTAGGKTQTREIAANSSLISKNSGVAHFGLGPSTAITNIQVRWPNGSVQNYPVPPANQLVIIDEDVQGPTIASKAPVHLSSDIDLNTNITIVLNENSFAVNGKQMTIRKTGETAALATIDVTSGVKTGNQYVFTLPVTLAGETEYSILLDAGAFKDRYANPSAGIGPGEWRFTTKAVPDVTPPDLQFDPPASLAKGFGTANPSLTVTDDIGVTSVVVSIRPISGSAYIDITASPGTTADTYTVTLAEASHFDATGAEFYITATDAAGNETRDPASGTYKVYLTYTASNAVLPSTSLGFGGAKEGWKVFSIPFELSSPNNQVANVFDEVSSVLNDKKAFRLITYGTQEKWSEYPDNFPALSRGIGYFINIRNDPGTITLFDGLQAPTNSRSELYQMNLKAGWNMIGNPYLTAISWDDVAELNGLTGTEAQLKTYFNGTYGNDQVLGPYEGGFVLMSAAKTVSIPFQGQTSSGGRRGVRHLGEDIGGEAWAIPLTLNQGDISYRLAGIGMAPDAAAGIDNYDDVTPPRFIDYLELNFKHPEHIAHNFTREIVPTQASYTWEFTVDSNLSGMATLVWNNASLLTSDKDLFLLDLSSQQLVNMKETGMHTFDPRQSSRFRIYYGDDVKLAPEQVHLGTVYPNPSDGRAAIPFSLPESGGLKQSVSLELVDALGHRVAIITHGAFDPGYHEAVFDATGMVSGFYTCRLTVNNRLGETTEARKLIIK